MADTGRGGSKASATLRLEVRIPPVIRIRGNEHPSTVTADASGQVNARHQLTVYSNLPRGFCITLRLTDGAVQAWEPRERGQMARWTSPAPNVRQACLYGPGQHALDIEHHFQAQRRDASLPWPVETDITAL